MIYYTLTAGPSSPLSAYISAFSSMMTVVDFESACLFVAFWGFWRLSDPTQQLRKVTLISNQSLVRHESEQSLQSTYLLSVGGQPVLAAHTFVGGRTEDTCQRSDPRILEAECLCKTSCADFVIQFHLMRLGECSCNTAQNSRYRRDVHYQRFWAASPQKD